MAKWLSETAKIPTQQKRYIAKSLQWLSLLVILFLCFCNVAVTVVVLNKFSQSWPKSKKVKKVNKFNSFCAWHFDLFSVSFSEIETKTKFWQIGVPSRILMKRRDPSLCTLGRECKECWMHLTSTQSRTIVDYFLNSDCHSRYLPKFDEHWTKSWQICLTWFFH